MDPLTSKAFLNIAFDLIYDRALGELQEEMGYLVSADKIEYHMDMNMRKIGYPAKDATYFAQALNAEDDEEITKNLSKEVLYEMAMDWLTRPHYVLTTEEVKEIRDSIDNLENHSRRQKNEFLKNFVHRITTRFINESEEPPFSS